MQNTVTVLLRALQRKVFSLKELYDFHGNCICSRDFMAKFKNLNTSIDAKQNKKSNLLKSRNN